MASRLLTFQEFSARLGGGYSRDQIRRLSQDGKLPPTRKIPGSQRVFWREDEVEEFLKALPVAGPRVSRAKKLTSSEGGK
jgi:predicted DNA-binding transcriptional regulator AlpA